MWSFGWRKHRINNGMQTVGVLALMAEDERERISQWTKAGMDEARRRAKRDGKPWMEA